MNAIVVLLSVICMFLGVASKANGYDDQDTHPRLSERAVEATTLNSFLKNNLGYPEGALAVINGNTIIDLLRFGASAEDIGACRRANHFHNPLQAWSTSYMSDVWQANAGCIAAGWSPTYSNVTWATGYLSPAPGGLRTGFSSNPPYAPYNWDRAKDKYYTALTSATTPARESNFAETFVTLGHVMHLLQDMAVPAHTRNDFLSHLMIDPVYGRVQPYEDYVKIYTYLVNTADPAGNFPTFQNASVTEFWDTDQYFGGYPIADTTIGLAEYSNANFFSDFTISVSSLINPWHSFPLPALSGTQEYDEIIDIGTGKSRTYIRKVGDGESVNHLAAGKWFYKYLPAALKYTGLHLDDKCHEDYARKLLPRAIGYSAGLLNYFFRGKIDITVPANGVYSMIDATQTGYNPTFTTIKLKATNTTTTGENMTNGTIHLVVKYKVAQADPFQGGLVQTEDNFTYRVIPEKNNVSALYIATPTELNFDLGTNGIPLWATDVYLQVVFKGTLGNEADAVAVGFKDISEPTPIDIFNNMDKVCINGSWYDAGSQAAVETWGGQYDVFPHDMDTIYLKFNPYSETQIVIPASPSVYDFKVDFLAAGDHIRGSYVLSDEGFDYSIYRKAFLHPDPRDAWPHANWMRNGFIRWAIKRQKDYVEDSVECGGPASCEIDRYPGFSDTFPADLAPVFFNFRGVSLWNGGAVEYANDPYPINSVCSFDDL